MEANEWNKPIKEIKKILIEGNQRFLCNKPKNYDFKLQRKRLIKAQDPFVIIIGCADSRVPPEIIFNCGLGDIFDLRVAGNIIDANIKNSINILKQKLNVTIEGAKYYIESGKVKWLWGDIWSI